MGTDSVDPQESELRDKRVLKMAQWELYGDNECVRSHNHRTVGLLKLLCPIPCLI